jgi:ribosomal protein S18 acetylase RimI-like enzyme
MTAEATPAPAPAPEMSVRRMTAADQPAVAGLFLSSFSGKLTAMLRGRPVAAADVLAAAALHSGDAWVAETDEVVGFVTFQDHKRPWHAHGEWGLARRWRLPWWRALRVTLFTIVFHAVDFPLSELYLETMAVAPEERGKGHGARLLEFADQEARRRGRRSVSLYCIRENPRARALYERHGYRVVRSEDLWWCAFLLGFRVTDMMRKALPPA